MNTNTMSRAQPLAAAIGRLVSGESLPPAGSADLEDISRQVGDFLRNGTPRDHEELGVRCLGLLIDCARARIATDAALHGMGNPL